MFEIVGLIGLVLMVGLVLLATWIILLPFYLLFRLLGFAIKAGFAAIMFAFLAVLLLPVFLILGAGLLVPLFLLAIPLMIAFAFFSWLVGFFRRDQPTHIVTHTVPPVSS